MLGLRSVAASLLFSLIAVPVASAAITLTGTVRDFHMYPFALAHSLPANPDFENPGGDDRGIVTTTLGADGKPVYGNHPTGTPTTLGLGSTTAADFFNQWYNDTPGYNTSLTSSI